MSDILTSTPRADGYAMPAEWAAQARCWMMWPTRPDTWRAAAAPAQATFATVANAIAEFEPVVIGVDAAHYRHARQLLSAAVDLQLIDSNDAWMRDIGPTFVRNGENKLRAVDWVFNAWGGFDGGLYQPWDADDAVAARVAELAGVPRYRAPLVLEGGAIHVDGEGSCLTTEQCLLNRNRNPALTRADIEQQLREYLGVDSVLWLGQGVYQDETDGHVDNLACFLRPGVVALSWCDDRDDPQHAISADALARLRGFRDARGRRLEVVKIPQPRHMPRMSAAEAAGLTPTAGSHPRPAGARLAASYVNFLLVNGALILPAFDDDHDARAAAILAEQFPTREIRQVPGREILLGGGCVHCITQQQPA
ncbi:MAG: agmatine deiminase [Gammaproteobacteria bacterium]|nr:agmatine deiminase [Gammaproteobacteria bacterium]